MIAELVWVFDRSRSLADPGGRGEREIAWSVTEIGQILFREYAFAFEATSVLILVAMLGAVTLAGRHLRQHQSSPIPNPESPIPTESRDQWRS
jgi:NADH:ubiquinone oxidoreductase subunit 6 (subunit J)